LKPGWLLAGFLRVMSPIHPDSILVGVLEHGFYDFQYILGIPTGPNSIIFQRGRSVCQILRVPMGTIKIPMKNPLKKKNIPFESHEISIISHYNVGTPNDS